MINESYELPEKLVACIEYIIPCVVACSLGAALSPIAIVSLLSLTVCFRSLSPYINTLLAQARTLLQLNEYKKKPRKMARRATGPQPWRRQTAPFLCMLDATMSGDPGVNT
jgi:hypothetical protein